MSRAVWRALLGLELRRAVVIAGKLLHGPTQLFQAPPQQSGYRLRCAIKMLGYLTDLWEEGPVLHHRTRRLLAPHKLRCDQLGVRELFENRHHGGL